MKNNIYQSIGKVSYHDRCRLLKQKGIVIWLTGLSGSGKSTIAIELEKKLFEIDKITYILDGDNLRLGLNSDLGFTDNERNENIRRVIEVAKLFKDAGIITIVAFISPFKKMRENARNAIGKDFFFEIYLKTDLATCIKRDPKGLYKKAVSKDISEFTGITSLYEEPVDPDLTIDTAKYDIAESTEKILDLIKFLIK